MVSVTGDRVAKEGTSGRDTKKVEISKESVVSRACQVQTVKGVPRKQSNLDTLNPFLVDEDDTDKMRLDQGNKSASSDYWNQLEKEGRSKSDTQGSDASTQTGRTVKKNGCKVM